MSLNRILEDLQSKPLIVVADPGEGKTVIAKELLRLFREKLNDDLKLQVFDPSGAWFHDAPLYMKQILTKESIDADLWRDESHCLYHLGLVDTDTRMSFVGKILTREYLRRQNKHLFDSTYLDNVQPVMYGLEEVQTVFPKNGKMPEHLFDVLTYGRNLNVIIFAMTQRLSECRTGLVERCNVLCGYLSGDNDRSKLKRGTSWEFLKEVRGIKTKSYEFLYYNGDIHGSYKVADNKHNNPSLVHNNVSKLSTPYRMPTL